MRRVAADRTVAHTDRLVRIGSRSDGCTNRLSVVVVWFPGVLRVAISRVIEISSLHRVWGLSLGVYDAPSVVSGHHLREMLRRDAVWALPGDDGDRTRGIHGSRIHLIRLKLNCMLNEGFDLRLQNLLLQGDSIEIDELPCRCLDARKTRKFAVSAKRRDRRFCAGDFAASPVCMVGLQGAGFDAFVHPAGVEDDLALFTSVLAIETLAAFAGGVDWRVVRFNQRLILCVTENVGHATVAGRYDASVTLLGCYDVVTI